MRQQNSAAPGSLHFPLGVGCSAPFPCPAPDAAGSSAQQAVQPAACPAKRKEHKEHTIAQHTFHTKGNHLGKQPDDLSQRAPIQCKASRRAQKYRYPDISVESLIAQQNDCHAGEDAEEKILDKDHDMERPARAVCAIAAYQGLPERMQTGNRPPAIVLPEKNAGNAAGIVQKSQSRAKQTGIQI